MPTFIFHVRALECMPIHGQSDRRLRAFKTEVNMLLGETLIMASQPKPQVGCKLEVDGTAIGFFCPRMKR